MSDDFEPSINFGDIYEVAEQGNLDIIYEEVLTDLFGRIKGIEVKGITVSRESLKTLYKSICYSEV